MPYLISQVASPHHQCQAFSLGTGMLQAAVYLLMSYYHYLAIIVIMTHSLFQPCVLTLNDFQSSTTAYMGSPTLAPIPKLEESFGTCHSLTEVDASKLYDIIMVNPLSMPFLCCTCQRLHTHPISCSCHVSPPLATRGNHDILENEVCICVFVPMLQF